LLLGLALKNTSYLSGILFPHAIESLARAACQSFSDHRLFDEHLPFDEHLHCGERQPFGEHPPSGEHRLFDEHQAFDEYRFSHERRSFDEHLHPGELLASCETLYHPNDAGLDLYTNHACSNSDYGPNPSNGYVSHRSGSDDIPAAHREYNQVV